MTVTLGKSIEWVSFTIGGTTDSRRARIRVCDAGPAGTYDGTVRRRWGWALYASDLGGFVTSGWDLMSPVDQMDPVKAAEALASFIGSWAEHLSAYDGKHCPEDGDRCVALERGTFRAFLESWGQEVGDWAAEMSESIWACSTGVND